MSGHRKVVQARRGVDLGHEPVGAAISVVGDEGPVPWPELAEQGVRRRHPAGEGQPVRRALESGQAPLEGAASGVGRPGVVVAEVLAHRGLGESRGLEYRRNHGAGARVGRLTGVDGQRLEAKGDAVAAGA